ncbi:MAG: hypothetical protein GC179_22240 [Anaerolineaceae bacterium]|nr:hypothetical protein [Anaerolineaceae bacterium]
MILPTLQNWDATRKSLHQAAQVVGGIKKVSVQPMLNYAHLGLYVIHDGLTSGRLSDGGELIFNLVESSIIYICPVGTVSKVDLQGHSQASLTEAVLKAMSDAGHPAANVDRSALADQTPLAIDSATAADYQEALYSIYTAITRFRARILGTMSPIIVFPHGFDASFLWFKHGSEERTDPHLNFGFSPGSAGFPRPYVYSYASPLPQAYFDVKLPELAHFVQNPWKGIAIGYDKLAAETNHEYLLEQTLVDIHAAVAPLLV